ncbi:hypothetical protein AMK19_30425 [Kitasatospora sp. CB01950]|nr:hypothetical protein AMK19_30425 [Kitasatospora sp. CB01950]
MLPAFTTRHALGRFGAVPAPLAFVLALLGSMTPTPADAAAVGQTLTCQGARHSTYSPALTNHSRLLSIKFTDGYGDQATPPPDPLVAFCVVTDTIDSPPVVITGSVATGAVMSEQSCTTLGASSPANVQTITWNGAGGGTVATSTVSWQPAQADRVNGNVVVTQIGTVTAGFGSGDGATRVAVIPELQLAACSTTGVTRLDGAITISFI